ncbi:hypothetical protein DNTS_028465, partial [Danionella cerebrum]
AGHNPPNFHKSLNAGNRSVLTLEEEGEGGHLNQAQIYETTSAEPVEAFLTASLTEAMLRFMLSGSIKHLTCSDFHLSIGSMTVLHFFSDLWRLASVKHEQSIYNTVCLVVLLTLPLLVLFTSVLVCCHCCCCRGANGCCRCCHHKGETSVTNGTSKKKKKQNGKQSGEDLWISVKADPMSSDRLAQTV